MTRPAMMFAGIAWIATLALAFMIGRATMQPLAVPPPKDQKPIIRQAPRPVTPPISSPALAPPTRPTPVYPQTVSAVPKAFRGRWDEIVADRCEGREARFMITATSVHNFEVASEVSKVTLYSPTEIDVAVTGYDEDKNRYNDTWEFKLVDSGKTLTGKKSGASFFRKCP